MCVCVCVFFPSILDIKFVGRTSRGHTGGRSHRIFNPVEPIKYVYVLHVLQQMDRFSLRGRRAYIAPSAVLVYPKSVNTVGWVCSSIY